MHRRNAHGFCIRGLCALAMVAFAAGTHGGPAWPSAAFASSDAPVLPPAIASLHAFRGRIEYVARQDGGVRPAVAGILTIGQGGWRLDERTDRYDLSAADGTATLAANGTTLVLADGDVFDADAVNDAWAAAAGVIASSPVRSSPGSAGVFAVQGLRLFIDPAGARLVGVSEPATGVSFSFSDWIQTVGLELPGRILRMRDGLPDASFTASDYRVTPALPAAVGKTSPAAYVLQSRPVSGSARFALLQPLDHSMAPQAACLLFFISFTAIAVVAWMRRDALIVASCRRLASDPRGWRKAGVTLFVEPDGSLFFEGARYRVGPHFYNRAALVQKSALFLRITAPAVPRAVVVPRKMGWTVSMPAVARARRASGFTLVETLVATAIFSAVVLLAVYPAMVAIARANAMAAQRSEAAVIASNALSDEETIDGYDGGAPEGSATTVIDDLRLTVDVAPGAMRGEHDLNIVVTSGDGTELAHVASWLGVPVGSPPNSGGGPPP